jgi:hypothetical protein
MKLPRTIRDVVFPSQEVHRKMLDDAEALVSILRSRLEQSCGLSAIRWHGGFARGEGGAYMWKERLWPFGDLDFEIVVSTPPGSDMLKRIEDECRERLGYQYVWNAPEPTWSNETEVVNMLDFKFVAPGDFMRRPADLALFDLAAGGRFLFGKEELPNPQDIAPKIPRWSGFRILANRLFNALQVFNYPLLEETPSFQRNVSLQLARVRLWLDLGNALLMSIGRVESTYRNRAEALEEIIPTLTWKSGGEELLWRAVGENYAGAIQEKFNPPLEQDGRQPLIRDAGVTAGGMALLSSPELLEKTDGFPSADQFAKAVNGYVAPRFYRDYLACMGGMVAHLAPLLSPLAHCYENLRWKGAGWTLKHPTRWFRSPEIAYLTAVPLFWFALDNEGETDEETLQLIKIILAPYHPNSELPNDWEALRKTAVEMFTSYRKNRKRPYFLLRK